MQIYVDADACPVTEEIFSLAGEHHLPVALIKSYAHFSPEPLPDFVTSHYVDSEKEAADFALMARVQAGDIVITQDYGLAAVCLAKASYVLHPRGYRYTDQNIDRLLQTRHEQAARRRAGQKTKGPRAFTREDKENFKRQLERLIMELRAEAD